MKLGVQYIGSVPLLMFTQTHDRGSRPQPRCVLPGKVIESAALDFSSLGIKTTAAPPFVFTAGAAYWVGLHHSSTATVRSVVSTALTALMHTTGGGANSTFGVLRQTVPFASLAPATWGAVSTGQLAANVGIPAVRGRVA